MPPSTPTPAQVSHKKCGNAETVTPTPTTTPLFVCCVDISTHIYTYLHGDIYKKCRNSHPHNKTLECFECRARDWSRVHFKLQPSRCQDNINFHQQHFNWRIRDPNCPFQFKLLLICWFRVGGCCSSFGKMKKKTELLQLIKSEKCWRTAAFSWRDTFAWRQFARFYARLQQRHVSFCHSCHSRNWQRKHYIHLHSSPLS